jgi:hypothetical protein
MLVFWVVMTYTLAGRPMFWRALKRGQYISQTAETNIKSHTELGPRKPTMTSSLPCKPQISIILLHVQIKSL